MKGMRKNSSPEQDFTCDKLLRSYVRGSINREKNVCLLSVNMCSCLVVCVALGCPSSNPHFLKAPVISPWGTPLLEAVFSSSPRYPTGGRQLNSVLNIVSDLSGLLSGRY